VRMTNQVVQLENQQDYVRDESKKKAKQHHAHTMRCVCTFHIRQVLSLPPPATIPF